MASRLATIFIALIWVGAVHAEAETLAQDDALQILEQISTAAKTLNYSGTFVYQHSEHVETSHIVHFVDTDGEHEKLETLDGPRREIIRNNDEVLCFYPDAKIVRSQKRLVQRSFPALLPEQLGTITEFYTVRKGRQKRIAGFDSEAVILEPKDGLRYGHRLWADANTGLLLKAVTLDESGQVVEQFAFTQLDIGAGVTREMVKPTYLATSRDWRMVRIGQAVISETDTGWTIDDFPPGFRKILQTQRTRKGGRIVVTHMVYSDGMAAVSIFIESMPTRAVHEGLARQGAINIYRRVVGNNVVTVLGETPAATVIRIGNSVSFQE